MWRRPGHVCRSCHCCKRPRPLPRPSLRRRCCGGCPAGGDIAALRRLKASRPRSSRRGCAYGWRQDARPRTEASRSSSSARLPPTVSPESNRRRVRGPLLSASAVRRRRCPALRCVSPACPPSEALSAPDVDDKVEDVRWRAGSLRLAAARDPGSTRGGGGGALHGIAPQPVSSVLGPACTLYCFLPSLVLPKPSWVSRGLGGLGGLEGPLCPSGRGPPGAVHGLTPLFRRPSRRRGRGSSRGSAPVR